MSTFTRKLFLLGCSAIAMMAAHGLVLAQEQGQPAPEGGQQPLPQVTVTAPKQAPKQASKQAPKRAAPKQAPAVVRAPAPPSPEQVQQAANRTVVQQTTTFDTR